MEPFKISEYGKATKGICFIFGAWRFNRLGYLPGIQRMNRAGIKCVLFVPNSKIIAANGHYAELVLAAKFVDGKVTEYLDDIDDDSTAITLGLSLGTLFAMEVGKRHAKITKIILAAPFGDFEDHIEGWKTHHFLKSFFEPQDTTGMNLVNALSSINLAKDIRLLTGKDLFISYSSKDTFVHTAATEKLIAKLYANDINLVTQFNKGGHFTGILKDYLRFIVHKHDALKTNLS